MSDDALAFFRSKRLAIFGAGYVGAAVALAARKAGAEVIALTRNQEKARRMEESGVRVVVDELQRESWHVQMPRVDLVLNCVSSGGNGPAGYRESYVEGTQSILRWLAATGPVDGLVYTSSTSVYSQNGGVVTENDLPVERDIAASEGAPAGGHTGDAAAYVENSRYLIRAESLIRSASDGGRAKRGVVLRLAGIYGPNRHHILDQLRKDVRPLPGRGDHRLNLIHRDDIVGAIAAAFARSKRAFDVFNVSDDEPTPKADVVAWLADRLGVLPPAFSGEGVSGRRANPPNRVISNAKAKDVLSWQLRFPNYRDGYASILGA
jgi:nucleoside-diphosphate-sugar epimerase